MYSLGRSRGGDQLINVLTVSQRALNDGGGIGVCILRISDFDVSVTTEY